MAKRKTAPALDRHEILARINDHFEQVRQWGRDCYYPENAAKHHFQAEALIEILEIQDCGSVGGFDKLSPTKKGSDRETGNLLYNRYLALLRRYPDEFPEVKSLTKYFVEIAGP